MSSKANVIEKKGVDCVSLILLHMELVNYMNRTRDSLEDSGKDIERFGVQVGKQLIEIMLFDRATVSPSFAIKNETLDIVKFICKDFWMAAFGRKVDQLRTNHSDILMMVDEQFLLTRSIDPTVGGNSHQVNQMVRFTLGIIKGALSSFGRKCDVKGDIKLPGCTFTITIHDSNKASSSLPSTTASNPT